MILPVKFVNQDLSEDPSDDSSSSEASYKNLDRFIGNVYRKNHEVMANAFGLSKNRLAQSIIWRLSKNGSKTSKQLVAETGASKGNVSAVTNRLAELGVIIKKQGSHGSEPLEIADVMKAPIRKHVDDVEMLLREAFHVLDHNERFIFLENLSRISSKLDKIGEDIDKSPTYYFHENEKQPNTHHKTTDNQSGEDQNHPKEGQMNNNGSRNVHVEIIEKQTFTISRILKMRFD